jgi:hypothetical protein
MRIPSPAPPGGRSSRLENNLVIFHLLLPLAGVVMLLGIAIVLLGHAWRGVRYRRLTAGENASV